MAERKRCTWCLSFLGPTRDNMMLRQKERVLYFCHSGCLFCWQAKDKNNDREGAVKATKEKTHD